MYSDIVSYTTVTAQKNLVLQASAAANVKSLSNTGEDQFAVFAADDTPNTKATNSALSFPKQGHMVRLYSVAAASWLFLFGPLCLRWIRGGALSFEAVYSQSGSTCHVDFYVNGKLVWETYYPNVSSQSFHMALCSHKVSGEDMDTSQNMITVQAASFTRKTARPTAFLLV